MTIRGIDVASYQPEHPDLDGFDFVFIKATEGTGYVNPKMRAQADWSRRHGRVTGFYAFLRPGSMKAQAQYFVRECCSKPGDPLWADWEDPGVSCADKDDFLREVKRLRGDSHRVGLYCNTNFWTHRDTTSYCADALWIATYNGHPGHPGIQHKWLFHQYTSSPIDTSISTFASREALKAWCTDTTASAPAHASKEDDMQLNDEVTLNAWVPKEWPKDKGLKDGKIAVETALGSTYGHARRAREASEASLAELGALRGILKELLAKVGAGGLTAAQIEAAAKTGAREALAELGKTLTDQEA